VLQLLAQVPQLWWQEIDDMGHVFGQLGRLLRPSSVAAGTVLMLGFWNDRGKLNQVAIGIFEKSMQCPGFVLMRSHFSAPVF
jgi:hypothetical protein